MERLIYFGDDASTYVPSRHIGRYTFSIILTEPVAKICFNDTIVPQFLILFLNGGKKTLYACGLSACTRSPQKGMLAQQTVLK